MVCLYKFISIVILCLKRKEEAYPLNGNLEMKLCQWFATLIREESHNLNRPRFTRFPSGLKIDGQERI